MKSSLIEFKKHALPMLIHLHSIYLIQIIAATHTSPPAETGLPVDNKDDYKRAEQPSERMASSRATRRQQGIKEKTQIVNTEVSHSRLRTEYDHIITLVEDT